MSSASKPNKPNKLTPGQTNLLIFTRRHQDAVFSGILSNIAEDQGYKVTEHTQFALSADLTELTSTELEPSTEDA